MHESPMFQSMNYRSMSTDKGSGRGKFTMSMDADIRVLGGVCRFVLKLLDPCKQTLCHLLLVNNSSIFISAR